MKPSKHSPISKAMRSLAKLQERKRSKPVGEAALRKRAVLRSLQRVQNELMSRLRFREQHSAGSDSTTKELSL